MQQDQIKGMLDRALAVLVTMWLGWMVKKGWLGESDVAALVPALVALPAIAYGWWNNQDFKLLQKAANVPNPEAPNGKTIIVADPALAAATPDQNNIVSSATTKVVTK